VLPAVLGRTGGNNIPRAASLAQSGTALAVIVFYAVTGGNPMLRLFFDLGTAGGFGVMVLLAVTSVAVIVFFARHPDGVSAWSGRVAPAVAAVLLTGIVILAVRNYAALLGVAPGDPAAWAFPASYAAVAVLGLGWGLVLKARCPELYAVIGLGARAVTARLAPAASQASR
jgi:hypothetical protein